MKKNLTIADLNQFEAGLGVKVWRELPYEQYFPAENKVLTDAEMVKVNQSRSNIEQILEKFELTITDVHLVIGKSIEEFFDKIEGKNQESLSLTI